MAKDIVIVVFGTVCALLVWVFWDYIETWRASFLPEARPVACTLEARACPDGSYVGRAGPDCEFEACPGAQ